MKADSTPYQVGITGGIGSGKSLVCKIFSILYVPVYDADRRAKELMTTDRILTGQIRKEFGTLSYLADGSLNRQFLAKQVFNQPEQLEKLNALVHPRVGVDYAEWLQEHERSKYVIKEAALLFEAGSAKNLDAVIAVYAPEEVRRKRVLKRDPQRSPEDVMQIMRNQMNEEEKMSRANFVIRNDDSQLVIPQILRLHQQFTSSKN